MDDTNLQNEITLLLYKMNYDYVRTRKEENYLCIAAIASVLKSNGFTYEDFMIPARNSVNHSEEELLALWNTALNSPEFKIDYLYDVLLTPPKEKRSHNIIYFDSIEKKEIEWLIPGFIPKGTITLISGDGGTGKGFVICDIINRITKNVPCFFENIDDFKPIRNSSRQVIYYSSEDDLSSVVKSKFEQAGVDQSRVGSTKITDPDFEKIKYDSQLLEDNIIDEEPVLVIFDPFQAFIDSSVNLSSRGQVRAVMNNLIRLGSLYGTTFILVSHTNKSDKRSGRGRIADTADIWDIARSVFIIGKSNDGKTRYFSNEKNNYHEEQPTTLFSIEDGAIKFEGTTNNKDDYYQSCKVKEEEPNKDNKLSNCKEMIIDLLRSNNYEISSRELTDQLEKDYSKATIKRAKDELAHQKIIEYLTNRVLSDGKRGTVVKLSINQIN